jgi:hypothetical protein
MFFFGFFPDWSKAQDPDSSQSGSTTLVWVANTRGLVFFYRKPPQIYTISVGSKKSASIGRWK